MKIPAEFDCIRPFEPEELPEVYDRLLSDSQDACMQDES